MANLRYEQAIMLADQDRDAATVATLSIFICLGVAAASAVIIALWRQALARLLGAPGLAPWLWAVPAMTLLFGMLQMLEMHLSRRKAFTGLSVSRTCQSVVTGTTQVSTGAFLHAGIWGLLVGYMAGLVTRVGVLLRATRKSSLAGLTLVMDPREMRLQARRHRKFPLFSVPGGLATFFGNEGITLLLGVLFTPATVGLFYLTHRTLSLPTSLISHSISPAFYQRLSTARREGGGAPLIAEVFMTLFMIAAVSFAVLAVVAPWLFQVLFGTQWVEAGRFAQVMMPNYIMMFCAAPITQAFFAYEKQEFGMAWHIGFFVMSVLAVWGGAALGGPLVALLTYGIGGALMYSLVVVMALRWAGSTWRQMPGVLGVGAYQSLRTMLGSLREVSR